MPNTSLKFDDLQEDSVPTAGSAAPSFDSLTDDSEKYNNPMDMIASAGQGALNTATLGLAPKAMEAVGFDPKVMREFKEANPLSYGVGQAMGLMSGPAGEAIGAAGAGAKALVGEGIVGSAAKLATEAALVQTTDEVAKAMLHDPNQTMQTAAINIGLSGMLGGAFGATGGIIGKGVAKIADSGAGKFLSDFRARLGEHMEAPIPDYGSVEYWKSGPESVVKVPGELKKGPFKNFPASPTEPLYEKDAEAAFTPITRESFTLKQPEISFKNLTPGQKAADSFIKSKLSGQGVGGAIGGAMGHATGMPYMGYLGAGIGANVLGPALDSVIKPLVRGVVSWEGFSATAKLIDSMVKGEGALSNAAKAVFDSSLEVIPSKFYPTEENREHLQNTLKTVQDAPESALNVGGGLEPYLPQHNIALGKLAGQTLTYLGSQQPKPKGGKLPLDTVIPPSKQEEAMFNRTLDIAQQPLMIMQHIKDGTLLSHDVAAFSSMYPALRSRFSQALISKLIDHKAGGGTVPYRTRVGLSLFSGQPLDSTMTPQALQSLQALHAPKQAPQQQAPKKGSTDKLSKFSSQYQTPEQSRETRRNK